MSSTNYDSRSRNAHLPPDKARTTKHKPSSTGLQLSWPRGGDDRRAIVGKSPSVKKEHSETRSGATRIVHVSHRDLEMYYHFTSAVSILHDPPILDIPRVWNSVKLEVEHQHLFQHFQSTCSRSLAVWGHDPAGLGSLIVRIALANQSTSATAVIQSLLALSALNLYDVCQQAVELKLSAIRALMTPLGDDIDMIEAMQHVTAGMLLLSFEIHQASFTSGEWIWYLHGVKKVIQVAGLRNLNRNGDLAVLLDWVYYHDVMARFSLRHWNKASSKDSPTSSRDSSSSPSSFSNLQDIDHEIPQTIPPALTAVELLSEVCDAISGPSPALAHAKSAQNQKEFLKILDWRIRGMQQTSCPSDDADGSLVAELFQLALLVYLNKASENILNQAPRMQQQIERAFTIISQSRSCDRQFAIFIFGCEARSDGQRAQILDLISRSERNVSSRSCNQLRQILQAIWVQDDLSDKEVNYWDRLSNVISCCSIIPNFV